VLLDLRCALVTPSREAWQAFNLDGSYRYGWMPPQPVEDDPHLLLVSVCPELIAATTLWLDDDDLDTYLTTVEAFLDAWVAGPASPVDEVYQMVEARLYEDAPDVLVLLSEVEMRALNDGVARTG
jgi:hypothetical protein